MSRRAQGRGAVAAFGMLVLCAGLIGGGVLWFLSTREANRTADEFARAAPGCTTTLTFTDPGEYYVFEELSGVVDGVDGCIPTATPGRRFAFVITDPNGDDVAVVLDDSVSYDLDAGAATSVGRIEIEAAGEYEISVVGADPAVNAAIGGDPDERVPTIRRAAIAAAAVGLVIGGLLLVLAGRRSRRAATFESPLDPGWGVTERDHERRAAAADWSPADPGTTAQVPVNPHHPGERRVAQLERDLAIEAEMDGVASVDEDRSDAPVVPPADRPAGELDPDDADGGGTDHGAANVAESGTAADVTPVDAAMPTLDDASDVVSHAHSEDDGDANWAPPDGDAQEPPATRPGD
jgi:hypothetical protein